MRFRYALFVVLVCSSAASSDQQEQEVQLHPSASPRRGRFLGLLGLLTGLTLVDSLDDGDGPPRIRPPTGIVKINIGRPFAESFYQHAYAYANPYYYGAVPTINIKIPLRPDGSVHEGLDGFGFVGNGGVNVNTGPAVFPGQGGGVGAGGGHFGLHAGQNLIEPRPQFADEQVPEVTEPSEKKSRKATSIPKSKRSKLPTTRIVRSTARNDSVEDQTGEASENQLEDLISTTTIPSTPAIPNNDLPVTSSTEEPLVLHATAIPVIEDTQASLPIAQSYYVHPGNHQLDVESISLTTTGGPPLHEGREFKPSRPDKLLNFYSNSVTAFSPDEFRPVAAVG
ncbi:uncharacterized protein LOC6040171 [Culex quinquefasciatus]|uniref:uncharacterized protein LOC6040171 n=1 Tax=Culex quinquefasciatus TaxID=7176 RepID=UPI0018E34B64|nr:uncharacterized protein LOC6040171 [Culex quinquefasciatus]